MKIFISGVFNNQICNLNQNLKGSGYEYTTKSGT